MRRLVNGIRVFFLVATMGLTGCMVESDATGKYCKFGFSREYEYVGGVEDWDIAITNGEAVATLGLKVKGDIVVPDRVAVDGKWYKVTTIATVPNFRDPYIPTPRHTELTSVSGGKWVTTIDKGTFLACNALKSVDLPNVRRIGDYAFCFCDKLSSVSLPNATSIGQFAFARCKALTSIDLPNVKSIGIATFSYSDNLASVSLPNAKSLGIRAFMNCKSLASASFPKVTSVGGELFDACGSLKSVELPHAKNLDRGAFSRISKDASIVLGDFCDPDPLAFPRSELTLTVPKSSYDEWRTCVDELNKKHCKIKLVAK